MDVNKIFTFIKMSYRILLIPHAGRKYSQEAVNKAARLIKPGQYKRLLVISTDHGLGEKEHSWVWSKEALDNTHLSYLTNDAIVYYAKNDRTDTFHSEYRDNIMVILYAVEQILKMYPEFLVIFNTDLTHFGQGYGNEKDYTVREALSMKEKWEGPLLKSLKKGDVVEEALEKMPYKPCGRDVLEILGIILKKFNYEGTQVSYYTSVSIDKNWDRFVSYVSMGFRPKLFDGNINKFVYNFMKRNRSLIRKRLPVFIGLKDIDTGRTCASMGDLERSVVGEKIKKLYPSLKEDFRSMRLRCKGVFLSKMFLYVNVLQSKEEWKTIEHDDYYYELDDVESNDDGLYNGVRVVWKWKSSIFIPAVWRENPEWNIYDILEALSRKSGQHEEAWRSSERIEIFKEIGTFT